MKTLHENDASDLSIMGPRPGRPARGQARHRPWPGRFCHTSPPHIRRWMTIDLINLDCHLLGKKAENGRLRRSRIKFSYFYSSFPDSSLKIDRQN